MMEPTLVLSGPNCETMAGAADMNTQQMKLLLVHWTRLFRAR